MTTRNIFVSAAVAALIAGAAQAQTNTFNNTGLIGDSAVANANEDLADDIQEDFERQTFRIGNEGRPQGFTGSMALRATAGTGDSNDDDDETVDLGLGANFGYVAGPNGYDLGLYYTYSSDNGDTTEDNLLYNFQYSRDFNPNLYGYALLQGSYDGRTDDDDDVNNTVERENDVFLGFGAGYRIYNTPDIQWSVQAGPGYRFQSFREIGNVVGDLDGDESEFAISLSSDYLNRINDNMFISNDTDIITSDSDTVLYNDLGLNVSMTDTLALRTSIQSEYHTDPAIGDKSTEHQFGVSLVYNFN
ncbi:DUF481 domain-containing protein [Maribius pontilimi]|uniref:DUF481 domain-containing protein n=1 Tax=Palleronia pontilimi TaxID=1964209 RepID=A0A934IJJ4_9RHOB|nr:DUF481 domain-containing protein [Palleronia pontilimi]MBJ3764111.1 DUF481 domain-containing protein [Palleronia pontilimi]